MCQPGTGCCNRKTKAESSLPCSRQQGNHDNNSLAFVSPPSHDVSEAKTLLYLHDCLSWTVEFSPSVQPHSWLLINLLCCGASLTILGDILLSIRKARAQVLAEELYLVYNCISTAIWCLQMMLTVLERRVMNKCLTWPIRLEVCLALFFFYSSVQLIVAWRVHDDDVAVQDLQSAVLNAFAYLYISYEMWMLVLQQEEMDAENNATTPVYHSMESAETIKGSGTPMQDVL